MEHLRVFFFYFLVMIVALMACSPPYSGKRPPVAAAGVLDLRAWDFERDGPVMLGGQWDFYWKLLIAPGDLSSKPQPEKYLIRVPGFWNQQRVGGRKLDADGYATYHLRVLLTDAPINLGIKTYDMYTAFRLYAAGQLVFSNGVVGTSREGMQPQALPGIAVFSPATPGILDIVVHVSNYLTPSGGIRNQICLGTAAQIQSLRERNIAVECMLFGIILIMGLYHIVLFLNRRKDPSVLYFGLFCLLFAGNTITHGERVLMQVAPFLSWRFLYVIIAVGMLSIPVFLLFLRCLFPEETPRWLIRIFMGGCGFLAAFTLLAPARYAVKVIHVDQIIIATASCICVFILTRTFLHKRQGAAMIMLGALPFFLAVLHDNFQYLGVYFSSYMLFPAGLAIFIFCQAYMLSVRYSQAYQAEERLSNDLVQTRNYLNNVFNSLSSILICVDENGEVTQWNAAAEAYTGISGQAALGRPVWDVLPLMLSYFNLLHEVLQTRKQIELTRQYIPGPDKTSINLSLTPLKSGKEYGAVIRVEDVSELERKEQQLRQAQKMESVGTLASGLAHDFNNVLGGIVGVVSLMKYSLQHSKLTPEVLQGRIASIENSTKRATDLVKQLLTLSRKQELSLKPVDLNQPLEQVARICENTFDKCVTIKTEYFAQPAVSIVDAGQIEQVILNLCINALHAMTSMRPSAKDQGGTLSLAIERFHAGRHFCAMHPGAREEWYWIIRIRDTGVGMDIKTLSKIFDPFFTTKEKGSGLGLAMVYNIIRQHGGFQDVFSEPGVGSTFNVYLPLHADTGKEGVAAPYAENYPQGSGLVLVVDDEEMIREMAKDMLKEGGYTVLTAVDGIEGVRLYQKHLKQISLVLLDMAMPRMSGLEAFEEIKKINPQARVLISSGFKQDPRVQEVLARGAQGFVPKPYTMLELLERIRRVSGG